MQLKYTIPLVPPSDNTYKGRKNEWQYRKDKAEWLEIVAAYCRPAPSTPFEKSVVTLTYFFKTDVRHDPDNYSGKFINDGLVIAGIIVDDDFKHIKLRPEFGGIDKNNPRTEITITEA
jgi:Holliday junction resolvase RusA-like endonuclease